MNANEQRPGRRQRILNHLLTTDPYWHYRSPMASALKITPDVMKRLLEQLVKDELVYTEKAPDNVGLTLYKLTEEGLERAEGKPWKGEE